MIAKKLIAIAIILIIIGTVLLIISTIILALEGKTKVEGGFGGFIGPIPFGFFTSKKMFWVWLALLIVGIIIWIVARKL